MEWISVKDRPLFKILSDETWEATEDGEKEFLAAVETNKGWWIKHCVIEDRIGLCIVGELDNEPAGFDLSDIQYFAHIASPSLK